MTLADFNLYIRGLSDKERMEQENLIRVAHTQATFIALAMNGKLKPIDTYLKRESKQDISYSVDKARDISSRIDKAKGEVV